MRWRRISAGVVGVGAVCGAVLVATRDSGSTASFGPLASVEPYGPTSDVVVCTPVARGVNLEVLINAMTVVDWGKVPDDLTFTGVVLETNDAVVRVDPVLIEGVDNPPGFVTELGRDGELPGHVSGTVGLPAEFDGDFLGGVGVVVEVQTAESEDPVAPHVKISGVEYETDGERYVLPTPLTAWFTIWPLDDERFCEKSDLDHEVFPPSSLPGSIPDPIGSPEG
jgi:hypothetical protein